MLQVMVVSPEGTIGEFLKANLSPSYFRVSVVSPGAGFVPASRREHPEIAVIDSVDERPAAAQLEIELLKEICPEIRIIALTQKSSPKDADIVEQGVFYYMTSIAGAELIQIIEAAARLIEKQGIKSFDHE